MSGLSIIVPFLGENQPFEDTLVSVLQNRPGDSEILVVHRGRYDDPYDLSGEVRFASVAPDAELLAVINAGFAAAEGEVVHVVQPGGLVEEGWAAAALSRFAEQDVGAVAPLIVDPADRQRIAAAGLGFSLGGRRLVNAAGEPRSRLARIARRPIAAPALAAAFYRRSAVVAVGGLSPEVGPDYADLDLGLALRALGWRCVLEPASVLQGNVPLSAAASYEAGRNEERVFWRYWRESGSFVPLLAHTGQVVGSVLSSVHRPRTYAQLAGRLAAALEWSAYGQHRKRLRQAGEAAARPNRPAAEEDDELPRPVTRRQYRGHAA